MRLTDEKGKVVSCKVVEGRAIGMLSEERLRILKLLTQREMYPAELARHLNLPTQTIYYHIHLLEQAGFLEFVEYEERGGSVAKRYCCTAESFAVVINNAWKEVLPTKKIIPKLLEPFVARRFFDGLLVVGSPDPHGKYRARASELSMLELTMLLGQYATIRFPLYVLDTQIKAEDKKKNLILAGGLRVNTIVAETNKYLPIQFDEEKFEVFSKLSKKRYAGNIGVIELVQSPFNKQAKILLIGGLKHHGTHAAVLATIKKMDELEKGNSFKPEVLAKIVEGYDEDGDGFVDEVEILE